MSSKTGRELFARSLKQGFSYPWFRNHGWHYTQSAGGSSGRATSVVVAVEHVHPVIVPRLAVARILPVLRLQQTLTAHRLRLAVVRAGDVLLLAGWDGVLTARAGGHGRNPRVTS